jgi:hypothetical protein
MQLGMAFPRVHTPEMPGGPMRVQPSRARRPASGVRRPDGEDAVDRRVADGGAPLVRSSFVRAHDGLPRQTSHEGSTT